MLSTEILDLAASPDLGLICISRSLLIATDIPVGTNTDSFEVKLIDFFYKGH